MLELNEEFLDQLGLGGLPEQGRHELLAKVYAQLELSVGTSLSSGLSDDQMDEFEAFIDHDEARTIEWLHAYEPAWLESSDAGALDIYDYASLHWLTLHRPDYPKVVNDALADIRLELFENREAIRTHFSQRATA